MAFSTAISGRHGQVPDDVATEETPLASTKFVRDQEYPLEISDGGSPSLFNIRVGGERFSVLKSDLERLPGSRLHLVSKQNRPDLSHGVFDSGSGPEYFFDRSSALFDSILNVYRKGMFHIPDVACPQEFVEELSFWMIELSRVAPCCRQKIQPWEMDKQGPALGRHLMGLDNDNFSSRASTTSNQKTLRQRAWILLESPGSSKIALVYMLCSCVMVVTTMIVLIMGSMREFQYVTTSASLNSTNITTVQPGLEIADAICVTWFSMDYLLRLWASPDRWIYAKSPLSVIDLLAVFPFYVEVMFNYLGIQLGTFGDLRRSLILLRILRVLRVLRALRVLKVARYCSGFQSMGKALQKSWRELALLVMFTLTANLMFSTAMYYVEYDYPTTHFSSIPVACWWCIITMTTVGYGDVYPQTTVGMLIGAVVSISGIILLAFPISIIVENFNEEYEQQKTHRSLSKLSQGLVGQTEPAKKTCPTYPHISEALITPALLHRHLTMINGKSHAEADAILNSRLPVVRPVKKRSHL